jgi:hypothetical protein
MLLLRHPCGLGSCDSPSSGSPRGRRSRRRRPARATARRRLTRRARGCTRSSRLAPPCPGETCHVIRDEGRRDLPQGTRRPSSPQLRPNISRAVSNRIRVYKMFHRKLRPSAFAIRAAGARFVRTTPGRAPLRRPRRGKVAQPVAPGRVLCTRGHTGGRRCSPCRSPLNPLAAEETPLTSPSPLSIDDPRPRRAGGAVISVGLASRSEPAAGSGPRSPCEGRSACSRGRGSGPLRRSGAGS